MHTKYYLRWLDTSSYLYSVNPKYINDENNMCSYFFLHSLSSGDLSIILSLVIKNATEKDNQAIYLMKAFY